MRVDEGIITEATFQGFGCAIARASASLMTESVTGKTLVEADELVQRVHRLVSSPPEAPVEDLGALSTLAAVRQFPLRAKCATLPWRTRQAAAAARDEAADGIGAVVVGPAFVDGVRMHRRERTAARRIRRARPHERVAPPPWCA